MKTLVSFSSGKDSAWMIHVLRQTPGVELGGLLTTVNASAGRVAMQSVPVEVGTEMLDVEVHVTYALR